MARPRTPSFDIELERLDTGESLGFVLAGGDGSRKWDAITHSPYPRQSLQTNQGGSNYASQIPPYVSLTQQDWIGGRGQLNFEADATRFFDSLGLSTYLSGKFFLSGNPKWTTGVMPSLVQNVPGSVTWTRLTGANLYIAVPFQANASPASFVPDVQALLRAVGTPGNLTMALYSATASPGNPNTSLAMRSVSPTDDIVSDTAEWVVKTLSTSLSASTWYFLVITNAGTDNADNYWQVGHTTGGATAGRTSANGSSWSNATTQLYYRIWGGAYAVEPAECWPFLYKNQIYAVVREEDGANSFLYMAGDRGAADSNTGALSTLIDATKAWTVNQWAGYIVLITAGPGSEEARPWREILSNTGTALTVTPDWNITHTTATEYVILADTWSSLQDLGGHVTDFAIGRDYIYFARGDAATIFARYEKNINGAWATGTHTELVNGTYLLNQPVPSGEEFLWIANNTHGAGGRSLIRTEVPRGIGRLTTVIDELAPTTRMWQGYGAAGIFLDEPDILLTGALTSYTLGDPLAYIDLDEAIDITRAGNVAALVRATGAASTVQIRLSDTQEQDKKAQALRVLHACRPYKLPAGVILFSSYSPADDMRHYDGASDWDHLSNAPIGDQQYACKFTIADTNDELYVGQPDQFDGITWLLDGTLINNNAATVTVKIWDGNAWVTVGAVTDGTASGGATLAQDGEMTWTLTGVPEWTAGSDNATNLNQSLFWAQLTFSAALDVVEAEAVLTDNATRPKTIETTTLARTFDADDNDYHLIWYWVSADWLYIFAQAPFDEIKIDMGASVNAAAATLSGEYFDGEEFVPVTNLSDGTASGGATLAQDGAVTFNLPDNMAELVVNNLTGYVVRLAVSATLTQAIKITEISVRNRLDFEFRDLEVTRHGEDDVIGIHAEFASGDYLYVCGQSRFDCVDVNLGAVVNNNAATFNAEYFNGNDWIGATEGTDGTASGGASLAQSGQLPFSTGTALMQRSEIEDTSGYWARVYWGAALDPVLIRSVSLRRDQYLGATQSTANSSGQWYYEIWAPDSGTILNGVDLRNIRNVVIVITLNKPTTFEMRGGVNLVNYGGYIIETFAPSSDRITGLALYGQLRQNPIVFTEAGFFEIQTQNNNAVVPVPLQELATLRSPANGRVSTTNDTYLYFNLGPHIQRYFNQTLDNVGWTRDEGLPNLRHGLPSFLLSAPGGVYGGVDAGSSGYSSLLFGQSRAWHDLFRAPKGLSVQAGAIQPIPGADADRLWLSVGGHLLFLPLPSESFDPTHDAEFSYWTEGHLITSWMSANLYSLWKLWKAVTVFQNRVSAGETDTAIATADPDVVAHVSYQLDYGDWDSGWTRLPEDHDDNPIEEVLIAENLVRARRIRFRIALRTDNAAKTPVVNAYIIDALVRFGTKFAYTFQHRVADNDEDKRGVRRKGLNAAELIRDTLNVWSNELVACRTRCPENPLYDGRLVVVEPSGGRPLYDDAGKAYLLETTLLEI